MTVSDTIAGISSLEANETVDLVIPYRGTSPSETAQVNFALLPHWKGIHGRLLTTQARIVMRYENAAHGAPAPRSYISTQSVFTGLPLTVNVQDFFRRNKLVILTSRCERLLSSVA